VTQQIIENWRPIRTLYPLATGVSVENLQGDNFVLPLHKGARRYIERDRPGFVEQHIDLIALVSTLAMAAASGVVGWTHRRRRAQKDRVDRYLTRILDARRQLRGAELQEAVASVDRIETEVLELVVAEKIEADSGLIAFLILCGSVRGEIMEQLT